MARDSENSGRMTVAEAGRKGGQRTKEAHGPDFYHKIGQKGGRIGGHKGGQRVRELIEKGRQAEGE